VRPMKMNSWTMAVTGLLMIASNAFASPSWAGPLDWIEFPGVCYDYDPYDRFQLYGKYYPYSGEECQERRRARGHKSKAHVDRRPRAESCTRSNIKNQRNACPG
jgi:hypothetical protein